MAHEKMLDTAYEYGDEDVNAVVAHIRKNTKTPSENGAHVAVLDVIASDKTSGTNARNFAATLNKHTRLNDTDYLTCLDHLLVEVDPLTFDSVSNFMASNYPRLAEEIKTKVVGRLGFTDAKTTLSKEEKNALQAVVKKEISQAAGEDTFDEVDKFLIKGDSKALILFPYNIGNYHWVLGEIEIERKGNSINVSLVKEDSLANRDGEFSKGEQEQIFAAVRSRLNDIFEGSSGITIKCESVISTNKKTQNDVKSCGAFTCHNLELRAQGKSVLSDPISAGAKELRQKQYEMAKAITASISTAKSFGGKWDPVLEKQLREEYPKIFKDVKEAKLIEHTVQTTDLTEKNLEEFVKSTKLLMEQLGLDSEVEVDAPAGKKELLINLCKKHGLKLAGDAKPAPAPVEDKPERMDKMEQAESRSPFAMTV